MVNTVKAPFDVSLDEPFGSFPNVDNRGQRRVTAAFGSEPVGVVGKLGLIVSLQERAHYFLQQFVLPRRDTERALLPVRLRDVSPSHWRPVKALGSDFLDQGGDSCQRHHI